MRLVHINQRKWPDTPHWHFDARWLGDDEYGTWVFVSADTPIQRGDDQERVSGADFVGLIPPNDPWVVEFYRDHPQHLIYVNIGTVPVWDGDEVTQIDLDLDVILTPNESVQIIDQDEFAEHKITLAYPPDLIALAQTAAEDAAHRLQGRVEPFNKASDPWWDRTTST